jgi:hypothetical protein
MRSISEPFLYSPVVPSSVVAKVMVVVMEVSPGVVVVKTSSPAESPSAMVAPSNMTSTVRHTVGCVFE